MTGIAVSKKRNLLQDPHVGLHPHLPLPSPRTDSSSPIRTLNQRDSGHKLITTGFRYQDLGIGRVAFDLLPKAVDMRFEGMGRDPCIIAPHFMQQDVPP